MNHESGDAVKSKGPADEAIAWIALDPETDRGENGLTPLILHRLGHEAGDDH